jgi:predicted sugar kinase
MGCGKLTVSLCECITTHECHGSLLCLVRVRAGSHLHATAEDQCAAEGKGWHTVGCEEGRLCVTSGKVRKEKKRRNESREVQQGNITLDRK